MPQFVKEELSKRWCVYGSPKNFEEGRSYCDYAGDTPVMYTCDARRYCSSDCTLKECVKEFLSEGAGGLNYCNMFLPTEDFLRVWEEVKRNERTKES